MARFDVLPPLNPLQESGRINNQRQLKIKNAGSEVETQTQKVATNAIKQIEQPKPLEKTGVFTLAQNDATNSKPARQVSLIEKDYNEAIKLLEGEEVNEHNIDMVIGQVLCLFRIVLRLQGKTDEQIERVMKTEIKVNVKAIQKNYKDWKQLAISITSGSLSIAGAAGSLTSLGGLGMTNTVKGPKFNSTSLGWERLKSGSGAVGQVGQAGSSFNQIAGNYQSSGRTGLEAELEMNKSTLRDTKESKGQKDQQAAEMMRNIKQLTDQVHQAFLEQAKA